MMSRRAILSVLAATARPALAAVPRLMPGVPGALRFVPLPRERLALHVAGSAGTIVLPVARTRIAAVLPLADRDVAVVALAADPPDGPNGGRLDLAAIVGWDGTFLRVLALEILTWRADRGARLTTRIHAVGDRTRLSFARDAAAPRGGQAWRRESWTDYLEWRQGGALADAPPRPPPPGTWQHQMSAGRAAVRSKLEQPCQCVDEGLMALCAPPVFGLD